MAPKRSRPASTTTNGTKAKIQKTLPFKIVKKETADNVEEKSEEEVLSESENEIENVPKGKDGKVDYKQMTNILSKDFVETSKHKVFVGAHLSISGKKKIILTETFFVVNKNFFFDRRNRKCNHRGRSYWCPGSCFFLMQSTNMEC